MNQKWVVRQFNVVRVVSSTGSDLRSSTLGQLSSSSCNNPNSCSGKTSSPNSQCHTRKRDGQNSNWFTPFVHRWIFHWSPLFKWCKLKKGRLRFLTLDQWVNQTPSSVDVVLAFTRVFKSCQNVAWVAFMLLSRRSPSWPSVCSSPNKCLRLLPSFHRTSGIIEGCAVMECWKFVYKYIGGHGWTWTNIMSDTHLNISLPNLASFWFFTLMSNNWGLKARPAAWQCYTFKHPLSTSHRVVPWSRLLHVRGHSMGILPGFIFQKLSEVGGFQALSVAFQRFEDFLRHGLAPHHQSRRFFFLSYRRILLGSRQDVL